MFRKDLLDLIRTSKLYRRTTVVSGVLLILTLALPAWKIVPIGSETPFIPLHYNVYMGVDEFGAWQNVFALPAIGAAILVVNTALQAMFFKRERILAVFLAVATVVSELVLLVSMVLIVLLNL